ncbi:MAG: TlpA family protein disulfide reductase [Acidobacteria bacterium]|nr:TlpA family protein disulfide reductase [Acidobacteriota bacterium]
MARGSGGHYGTAPRALIPVLAMALLGGSAIAVRAATDMGNASVPLISSLTANPKVVQQNRTTRVALTYRFSDAGRDLRGGMLKVTILRSSGGEVELTYALTKPKHEGATGQETVPIDVMCDTSSLVKITARLQDAGGRTSQAKTVQLATPGTEVGQQAANFTLVDQSGHPVSLRDYAGKVILLHLSAMWCRPCQSEAEDAEELQRRYKDRGFVILGVLIEDYAGDPPDQTDQLAWANSYSLTFPVLASGDSIAWNLYDDEGYIPLNVIIGRDQVITYKDVGYTPDGLETEIVEALNN